MPLEPLFRKAFWALAASILAYGLAIFALTVPSIQRNVLYAHKVNPAYFQNLSDVEQFGFLRHQVQPFTVVTPDNETIYAWHILPLHLYYEHKDDLIEQVNFGQKSSTEATDTLAFKILANDSNAHVIVNFHGNAAHLSSAYRPATYNRQLSLSTPERPVHVIAFDYRGFGWSTGSPTEDGLTTDAETLLSFLTGQGEKKNSGLLSSRNARKVTLSINPSQIILFGQSLGTAVATSVTHRWTILHNRPSFKALILVSGFTSLPTLLDAYSIRGIVPPLLSPLNRYPRLKSYVISHIADTWHTSHRISELISHPNLPIDITILHAFNDWEIPWREGYGNWIAALAAAKSRGPEHSNGFVLVKEELQENLEKDEYPGDVLWTDGSGAKWVRWERSQYGGHNKLAPSNHAGLAVLRVLNGEQVW